MDMSLLIENLNKSVFTRNDLFQAAKKLDSSFKETQLRYYVEKLRDSGAYVFYKVSVTYR